MVKRPLVRCEKVHNEEEHHIHIIEIEEVTWRTPSGRMVTSRYGCCVGYSKDRPNMVKDQRHEH